MQGILAMRTRLPARRRCPVYTPALREDQIHQLYLLRKLRRRPMSKILRQIVDEYLEKHQDELKGVEVVTVHTTEVKRSA
jgi:hypothetical protein